MSVRKMNDKIISHMSLDHSNMQLEVLTGMDLGSCVISRNGFPHHSTLHCSCFLSKGTERATRSMAKFQLFSVVRDTHEDWRAGMAREGKIGMSWEGTFTAKGGRTILQCRRGSQAGRAAVI